MIASPESKTQVLTECDVWEKIKTLPRDIHQALSGSKSLEVPSRPGRDAEILFISQLPEKMGLASREGQARRLHDLASIELQAMELALRTIIEFPRAPEGFRQELAEVALDEARHLELCLKGLEELSLPWGTFPVHLGLWKAVDGSDSLLDRILIVHRFLEGSGLDASFTFLKRLNGVAGAAVVKHAVQVIYEEEKGHVRFGSTWYREIAVREGLDPADDFAARINRLFLRLPRRLEPIQRAERLATGFTEQECYVLEEVRNRWIKKGQLT